MATSDPAAFPDDEQNPYAPPRAEAGPELTPYEYRPVSLSVGDVLTRSWEIYRDRMGMCLGVVWGCQALNFAAQLVLGLVQAAAPQARNPEIFILVVNVVGNLISIVFQLWLTLGQTIVLLDIARGREAVFNDIFSGGRYVLQTILAFILLALLAAAVFATALVPGAVVWAATRDNSLGPIALALGGFAALVVVIVLSLRVSQFLYLIVDRDANAIEAIRGSWEITRGNALMIFVVFLLAFAITIGGFLAVCIGVIFTIPFTTLMHAVMYVALTGQPLADPRAKGEPLVDLEPI